MLRVNRTRPRTPLLALDLSLNSTGYAYCTADGEYRTGLVKPPAKLRGVNRLAYNRSRMTSVLQEVKPTQVIVEGYAMGGKGLVFNIGEWGGVARLAVYDCGAKKLWSVTPSSLKLIVAGKGTLGKGDTGKEKLLQAVASAMGDAMPSVGSYDESDALALLCVGEALIDKRGTSLIMQRLKTRMAETKSGVACEDLLQPISNQ